MAWLVGLGELDAEGCRRIAELRLWEAAEYVVRRRPDRLKFLAGLNPGWVRTQQYRGWRRLFTLDDEGLLVRLLAWFDAAAEGGAIREDVLAFADLWEVAADSEEYARFLARHFWVLDAAWRGLRSRLGGGTLLGQGFRFRVYLFPGRLFLDLLLEAEKQGWRDSPRLAEILSSRSHLFHDEDADGYRLCLELAGGDPARFERLFEVKKPRPLWGRAAEALAGWQLLKRSAAARAWLPACVESQATRASALRVLERAALAAQIQLRDRLRRILKTWESPAPVTGLTLPAFLPEDLKQAIVELAAYSRLAGERDHIPKAVRKILERPQAMGRELAALERKQAEGNLPPSAAGRAEKLRGYLEEPRALEQWIVADARPACRAEAPRVRLRALGRQLEKALGTRWRTLLGQRQIPLDDPGWDSALHLHYRATANRRFLRALLQQVLEQGRGWPLEHPRNAAFEEEIRRRGVDIEVWKSRLEQKFQVHIGDWVGHAENDPLRIFETVSLFGAGRAEDFAEIANAVEANKRVLLLRNQRGAIVGRKLIGLVVSPRRGAVLVGFRSYGAQAPGDVAGRCGSRASGWVKVVFDVFCHEIARRIGARLAGPGDGLEDLSRPLPLFAKWHSDGAEPFDEWVIQAGAGTTLVTAGGVRWGPRAALSAERPEQRAAVARALLWLGANALPVLEEMNVEALGAETLDFVRRHTASPEVWRWLGRRM